MATIRMWKNVGEFVNEYWIREGVKKRNEEKLLKNGYLRRNMSGTIRGASSGYSPYLQAWTTKSGKVISKVTWGCYTLHGVTEFASKHGETIGKMQYEHN